MDLEDPPRQPPRIVFRMRLLGPLALWRTDARRDAHTPLALPASRKVRALLAFLALSPQPVGRSALCELLWDDGPDDPRGELRWCLSRIRALVDDDARRRVVTADDRVGLDLADCAVDALEVTRALAPGLATLAVDTQQALVARFGGELLEGFVLDGCPAFDAWLASQRRRFREAHAALLNALVEQLPDDTATPHLEAWLRLAPFDPHVHQLFLENLARRGRVPEGDAHVNATVRRFVAEGLDVAAVREVWRVARARAQQPNFAVPQVGVGHAEGAGAASLAVAPFVDGRAPFARGDVSLVLPAGVNAPPTASRRASIAVMPFVDRSAHIVLRGGAADALAHDVITRSVKLRSLFVIAEGTVFALHDRHIGPQEAGRMLNVDFVVSGAVRQGDRRLRVDVELAETRSGRIVWAETFDQALDDAFLVLDAIGNRIVASVASEIESVERNRAILKPPESLDAWEAHHRGLWHMYRFNRADNALAREFFARAVRLDPTFARAFAGLSFTHFQNAFQGWADRRAEIEHAYAFAGQSLMADDRDPAAHWAMGRALWLRGLRDACMTELDHAVSLSPNFAQGHYTLAFVHAQAGDPEVAIASSDHSRNLSPFDPLLFGMLGARAMALVRLRRFDEAAEFGVRAAMRPNAHEQILAIAGYTLALAGRVAEGREHIAAIRAKVSDYDVDDFLTAMHFDEDGAALFREAARRVDAG